jgi:hypothetical protein
MATVTRPPRAVPTPAAPAADEPREVVPADARDPSRPHAGDRVAFVVWVLCVLFMVALLTHDAVTGLFR